ncbi:MAG: TonB-dependent receptor plug domain-containing protein [Gemmatimonadales bacterium]
MSLSRVSSAHVIRTLTCVLSLVAVAACAHTSAATYEQSRSFPGVRIVPTPTGGFSVRILSGLVSDGQPLYIVNGERVTVEPTRGIDWFQPEDIARITILKDPSETAVYGPSGVNGVVLITTRQAMRPRK